MHTLESTSDDPSSEEETWIEFPVADFGPILAVVAFWGGNQCLEAIFFFKKLSLFVIIIFYDPVL